MRAKLGPLAVGTSVFLGIAYWDYWLRVRGIHNSYLLRQYERIIDGSAPAPDQYRPLVPKMAQLVSHAMSLETAIGAVESGVGVCAAIALFVFAQRRRVGPIGYVLACFACGWWALSLAFYPRPEPLAALLAVTIVAVGATLDGWRRRSVLAFGALLLVGTRTDVLFAFGVGFAFVGLRHRRWLVEGLALGTVAAAATDIWVRVYPDAGYPKGSGLLQLNDNLNVQSIAAPVVMFLPLSLVVVGAWRRGWPPDPLASALGVALAFHVGLSLFIAEIQETRVWFPWIGIAAVVAYDAWTSSERAESSRSLR